ncbi:MAG TPA: sulfotransferase domain-containing protein [Caulobacteraceae bacterium]|nr:sulfotransferase domain-containing protein [Caulobacteraceae bacterium]
MDAQTRRRARSMAEMAELQAPFFDPKEIAASIKAWRPRPTDVVITPFGKCGTTWLQQTFHTLRTRGDMDFDDISRVVPWIETAITCGIDINAEQRAEPRGFKSHLTYDLLPRGAKAVVSLRDPKDALVSNYRFMEGWFFERGSIPLADYAQGWLREQRPGYGYWNHLVSWWEQKDKPGVLVFSYEHMSAEPETHIRRLAAFCGIPLDDELLALTLERSSLPYMLAHKDRFDDAMMRRISEERCGLPPGSDSAKVREGKVGSHRQEMPAEIAEAMDAIWTRDVTPRLGFATYADLEAALRSRAG